MLIFPFVNLITKIQLDWLKIYIVNDDLKFLFHLFIAINGYRKSGLILRSDDILSVSIVFSSYGDIIAVDIL